MSEDASSSVLDHKGQEFKGKSGDAIRTGDVGKFLLDIDHQAGIRDMVEAPKSTIPLSAYDGKINSIPSSPSNSSTKKCFIRQY